MNDGRHMLSGEGGTASSPKFKSKRWSEGPDIFKVLKKEEIGQIKILEVQEGSFHKRKFKCALKRTACLYKKSALDGISEIEEASSEFEKANSKNRRGASFLKSWARSETTGQSSFPDLSALVTCNLYTRRSSEIGEASCFSRRVSTRHTQTQLCGNHGQFVKAPIPDIKEAPVFFSLVNTRHAQTQLCGNHGQFVEAPIPDTEEAPVFFQPRQHLSHTHSA
ncbi:hypothetical protein COP2_004047 [Malus domestica]